jgi:hypothetical protein
MHAIQFVSTTNPIPAKCIWDFGIFQNTTAKVMRHSAGCQSIQAPIWKKRGFKAFEVWKRLKPRNRKRPAAIKARLSEKFNAPWNRKHSNRGTNKCLAFSCFNLAQDSNSNHESNCVEAQHFAPVNSMLRGTKMWAIAEPANALVSIRSKCESDSNDTDTRDLHSEVMTGSTADI